MQFRVVDGEYRFAWALKVDDEAEEELNIVRIEYWI